MPDNTLWESRVLVTYNQDTVHLIQIAEIRKISASLIDFLEAHKKNRTVTMGWEEARVYAHAMTVIEDACMWSIKAICK